MSDLTSDISYIEMKALLEASKEPSSCNKKQDAMDFFSWLYDFNPKAAKQFVAEQRYKIMTGNVGLLTSEKLAAMQDGLASGVLIYPYTDSVSKGAVNTGDSVAQ